MFLVPAASPWWSTILRSEIVDGGEDDGEDLVRPPDVDATPTPAIPGSTLNVFLHTRRPDLPGLIRAEREIPYVRGVIPQIRAVVSELAVGSPEVPALLPEGTTVLDVAYAANGTAYIDFSPEFEMGRGVGADEERLLVQGIVTTITDNFSAIRKVVILVDGRVPKPGHLDLTRALRRDDPSFTPEADPASEPDPGPLPPPQSVLATPRSPEAPG